MEQRHDDDPATAKTFAKRNRHRFPADFMFRLSRAEFDSLTSQNAMSKTGRGGRRTLPFAFTEHGALQAANVHRSLSKRFPFAIYYHVEADVVRVRAILDCRRNPSWIRRRVRGQ